MLSSVKFSEEDVSTAKSFREKSYKNLYITKIIDSFKLKIKDSWNFIVNNFPNCWNIVGSYYIKTRWSSG